MVKYIKPDNAKTTSAGTGSLKKYLAIGATIAVIGAGGYEYQRNAEHWKPRVHTVLGINSSESLEYRIDSIKEDLKAYPQYTDMLVREGIEAVRESEQSFSTDTYADMFDVMKEKFEEKPQLLDHLGPNAIDYQESKLVRKYKQGIDELYQNLKHKAVETKDRIKEMMK